MSKPSRRFVAFTLVELLVVVAIIALLLGILRPALAKARQAAKDVVCQTSIKTLGLGYNLYVASNKGKGFYYNAAKYGDPQDLWLLDMADQVSNLDKARYCPMTEISPKEPPFSWPNGMGSSRYTWIWPYGSVDENGNTIPHGQVTKETAEYGSYAPNWWMYADRDPTDPDTWGTTDPDEGANVPMFVDCKWVDFIPRDTSFVPADWDLENTGVVTGFLAIIMNRHGPVTNVGFIDGHVEPVKLEMLWSLKWGKSFETRGAETRTDGSPIYQPTY